MKHKVCVVTGTRADYGLLRELLFRLQKNSNIELNLLVTGSHLSDSFGKTQLEIEKDGFLSYSSVPIPIDDDTKEGMAKATGSAIVSFTDYFSDNRPNIIVVLGDRYEILSVAISAHMLGIPIAHISGGDVTEGAIDDAVRHSITKMSQIHFPGCEQSRRRIIQMGEYPERVFNVGEPGVENCLKIQFLSREEIEKSISFSKIRADYSIVTFHPVTMEDNTGIDQLRALINAMDSFPNMSYIITLANADAGGRAINEIWIDEGKRRENWFVVRSLGVVRYLSALRYAKLVIGNSSSGIVEAPSMGIPTINIGDRQKGRMMAESVICCDPTFDEIRNAMEIGLTPEMQEKAKHVVSPFGDGSTSELIEKHLVEFLEKNHENTEKHFYDIDFVF